MRHMGKLLAITWWGTLLCVSHFLLQQRISYHLRCCLKIFAPDSISRHLPKFWLFLQLSLSYKPQQYHSDWCSQQCHFGWQDSRSRHGQWSCCGQQFCCGWRGQQSHCGQQCCCGWCGQQSHYGWGVHGAETSKRTTSSILTIRPRSRRPVKPLRPFKAIEANLSNNAYRVN